MPRCWRYRRRRTWPSLLAIFLAGLFYYFLLKDWIEGR